MQMTHLIVVPDGLIHCQGGAAWSHPLPVHPLSMPLPLTLPSHPFPSPPAPRPPASLCLLQEVGEAITRLPEDFTPHRQIAKVYEARKAMVESGQGIDWGMAEALAFGTLLAEGGRVGW